MICELLVKLRLKKLLDDTLHEYRLNFLLIPCFHEKSNEDEKLFLRVEKSEEKLSDPKWERIWRFSLL